MGKGVSREEIDPYLSTGKQNPKIFRAQKDGRGRGIMRGNGRPQIPKSMPVNLHINLAHVCLASRFQ